MCVSSLMEAAKRHRIIAEAVEGVEWPTKESNKGLGFEFEVEQVSPKPIILDTEPSTLGGI